LETDAAAIAARVSRPRADTTDIVINEQTVRDACMSPPCILMEEDADDKSRHSGTDCSSVLDSCRYKIGLVRCIDLNTR